MNLKYFIVKGKKKYCSIYVRFWDSKRIDQKTKTGISVEPKYWSETKQRIKSSALSENIDFLNDRLNKLESFIFDKYNKDFNDSTIISKKWLRENTALFFNRLTENQSYKRYLVDWSERYIRNAASRSYNGLPIKKSSLKNYTTTLNKLKAFEKHEQTRVKFEDINLKFHNNFVNYCKEIEKLNNNSIGNLISRIKTFCRNIELEGYQINPMYKHREFVSPKNETLDVYLTEKEINAIFNHDFATSNRLNNARDLFIIGLTTGLRISDFLRITKQHILKNVINITTQKTNQNLIIPIHPLFKKTIKKYNGNMPTKISDQKFNKYIKEVCREVGIIEPTPGALIPKGQNRKKIGVYPKNELIQSHTCRRSFATNLYLGGIDTSIIMKATGHKSEKQLLQYIKATQNEHVEKISKYWDTISNQL